MTDLIKSRMATGAGALVAVCAFASMAMAQTADPVAQGEKNVPEFEPAFANQTRAPAEASGMTLALETVVGNLEHPWGLALLPDGAMLVTERPGRLRVITADGQLQSAPVKGVPKVHAVQQGGLLDVAIAPDFSESRLVYWTYAEPLGGGMSVTAAARGRLTDDMRELTDVQRIFQQTPPSPSPAHYGSRIDFDAQGRVIITTGEHFTDSERLLAQDLTTTYGKVIRINPDGTPVDENAIAQQSNARPEIYTYGHRNIQGLDIDPATGEIWTVEHGPQGGDELNRLTAGANYGWPVISYGENYGGSPVGSGKPRQTGMEEPVYYWDPVIAPGDMVFYQGAAFADWQGDLLVTSLNPGGLVRLNLQEGQVIGEEWVITDQGRIRDVDTDASGALLLLTDDPDGAVLRVTPASQ